MRKLATIRVIAEVQPIPGADLIEHVRLDGWWTVARKGEFSVGDLAIYFEIDSWIPKAIAPFLCTGKVYQEVEGARLKTARKKGAMSQGLALPLSSLEAALAGHSPDELLGADVTELLGVLKWEKPEISGGCGATRGGRPRGNFPSFIRKTDQERVQNLTGFLFRPGSSDESLWEKTEKLDGTSCTIYSHEGKHGVCSRNLDLQEDDSLYWTVARSSGAVAFVTGLNRNLAVQSEIVGPGVQGNPYKLVAPALYVFDIFDIDRQKYLLPTERKQLLYGSGLLHVPTLSADPLLGGLRELLDDAEGPSLLNAGTEREGVVWKSMERPYSFKVISNRFLLAEKG